MKCLCCGCFATIIAFCVFLGLYAFNNPEPDCFYIPGSDTSQPYLAVDADVEAEGVEPIHEQFVTWFTWMFANMMILFVAPCIGIIVLAITDEEVLGAASSGFCACACSCSLLVAYIMGLVWRYGKAGKFASGDTLEEGEEPDPLSQISNGRFLSVYYLISWVFLGITCCCGLIGCIAR